VSRVLCVIAPDADRPTIEAKIREMRTRQLLAVIPSTAAEVGAEIDRLIEMWKLAPDAVGSHPTH
jgi:hypothetical protein